MQNNPFSDLVPDSGSQDANPFLDLVPKPKSLGGFAENAATNLGTVATGLANAIAHPIGTAKGVGKFALGGAELAGAAAGLDVPQKYFQENFLPQARQIAGDVGFVAPQNGGLPSYSLSKLGENFYNRPADVLMSASAIAAPMEGIPGKIGRAAEIANPINTAGKVVKGVASIPAKLTKNTLARTSGLGPEAISEAYRSGAVGGAEGQAFRDQMRGVADPNAPVDEAKAAVDQLRQERSAEYQANKAQWADPMAAVTAPLKFQPIEDAFQSVAGIKSFRGKAVSPSVQGVRDEIRGALDEWKADPGSWTAEGFDALKQRIADIGEKFQYGTPQRKITGTLTNAIRREISKQAPDYASSMKAYAKASQAIDEVTRTFSLGKKMTYDTALRKLQSVLRNNAFTNYSARAKLAQLIQERAPELMPALAGQAMNTFIPRGLAGQVLTGAAGLGAIPAAVASLPAAAALATGAVASSPRLIGETVHGLGRVRGAVTGTVKKLPKPVRAGFKASLPIAQRLIDLNPQGQ